MDNVVQDEDVQKGMFVVPLDEQPERASDSGEEFAGEQRKADMTDDERGKDKSKEEKSQKLGTLISKFKDFLNRGQNEEASEPKIKKKQTMIVTSNEEASPMSEKAPTSLAD